MKKLILSLFVAGSLTFGLQSCSDDDDACDGVSCPTGQICDDGDCVTDPNAVAACDECGVYDTEADGYMSIPAVDIDTTWSQPDSTINIPAEFLLDGSDYKLSVDLTSVTDLLADPIVVGGDFNAATQVFTVDNFEYTVLSLVPIVINGSVDFSTPNEASGSLTIAPDPSSTLVVDGQLNFSGVKQ